MEKGKPKRASRKSPILSASLNIEGYVTALLQHVAKFEKI
jgi:hypothetical protein